MTSGVEFRTMLWYNPTNKTMGGFLVKKVVALALACVLTLCMCALVSFADDPEFRYALNATGSGNKQYNPGDTVNLSLILNRDGNSFSYCQLGAVITVPFEITDVSYTIPGQSAVSVQPVKSDPEKDAGDSNPYRISISYAPTVPGDGSLGEQASGNVGLSFKIAEEAQTGYKDITVESIEVYVYEQVAGGDTSSEDTSSEDTSGEVTSSEAEDEDDTQGGDENTSVVALTAARSASYVKSKVDMQPKSTTDVNGSGKTLRVKVNNPNATNTNLASLEVEGFTLSPEFASNIASYTVNVDADTTQVLITAVAVNTSAVITFKTTDAVSVSATGLVTLSDEETQRVTVTVSSSPRTAVYTIEFVRPGETSQLPSDVSSETESDESDPDIPGTVTSTGSSSDDVTSDVSSEPYVPGSTESSGGGMDVLTMALIILLSLGCGFVLCLILVNTGVINRAGAGNGARRNVQRSSVDDDIFTVPQRNAPKSSGSYTATRVMPIPNSNEQPKQQSKKFEVNIEYDNLDSDTDSVTDSGKTGQEAKGNGGKEEKKKNQFFFDDDEF